MKFFFCCTSATVALSLRQAPVGVACGGGPSPLCADAIARTIVHKAMSCYSQHAADDAAYDACAQDFCEAECQQGISVNHKGCTGLCVLESKKVFPTLTKTDTTVVSQMLSDLRGVAERKDQQLEKKDRTHEKKDEKLEKKDDKREKQVSSLIQTKGKQSNCNGLQPTSGCAGEIAQSILAKARTCYSANSKDNAAYESCAVGFCSRECGHGMYADVLECQRLCVMEAIKFFPKFANKVTEDHAQRKSENSKITKEAGKDADCTTWADKAYQIGGSQANYDRVMARECAQREAEYSNIKNEAVPVHTTSVSMVHKIARKSHKSSTDLNLVQILVRAMPVSSACGGMVPTPACTDAIAKSILTEAKSCYIEHVERANHKAHYGSCAGNFCGRECQRGPQVDFTNCRRLCTYEVVPLFDKFATRMKSAKKNATTTNSTIVNATNKSASPSFLQRRMEQHAPEDELAQEMTHDLEMNFNKIAPFGKEDTAKELQDHAAKTQDTLVDAVENAEVAEIKRAVFRALTRLRAATIKEFDTIARLETQAIDAYNDAHHYRAENPLTHLHEDEAPVETDKLKSFH